MRLNKALSPWFDQRLKLGNAIHETLKHPVPSSTPSWAYVFGNASLTLMLLQFITGIFLAFVYVPAAGGAWTSLQVLNHQRAPGWFMRALHEWGLNFIVALVVVHLIQVFLFGAFKYPRELTWIVGVFLLLITLCMAFTGQVLCFDQDAYWRLGIGASVVGRVPLVGAKLVHVMLGGPIIAGETTPPWLFSLSHGGKGVKWDKPVCPLVMGCRMLPSWNMCNNCAAGGAL